MRGETDTWRPGQTMKIKPDDCLNAWDLSSHTLQRHSLMLGITIHPRKELRSTAVLTITQTSRNVGLISAGWTAIIGWLLYSLRIDGENAR